MSLIIRNARMPFTHDLWCIYVDHGVIDRVVVEGEGHNVDASEVVDAQGGVVFPAFVDAHLHLDKVYISAELDEEVGTPASLGDSSDMIIKRVSAIKEGFTEGDVAERGRKALGELIKHGTAAVRAFADVDPIVGLKCIRAVLALKREFRDFLDVQVVAFPQEGLCGDPQSVELLHKAVELGADVVGGIPWYENSPEDVEHHLDIVFEVAKSFDRDIHVVADDTDDPLSTNLLRVASRCVKEKYFARVAASQCRGALDSPNDAYAKRVVRLAKLADLSVVENPHISLMLSGGVGGHPSRRGITRVAEFAAAGVNVAAGQDDIVNPFYPFGRGSMVEVGYMMCHAARLHTVEGLRLAYNTLTQNGAKLMKLPRYGLKAGCKADLAVFEQRSVRQVFERLAAPKHVVLGGELVLTNTVQTTYRRHLPGSEARSGA